MKKKPVSHSQCVSLEAEQEVRVGRLGGHFVHGMQGLRLSDEENVPGKYIKWCELTTKFMKKC